MQTRSIQRGLAALCVGLATVLPAHAALTLTGVSCSGQGTGMTSLAGELACGGSFSGNDLNQQPDVSTEIFNAWGLTVTGVTSASTSSLGASSGTLSFAQQTGLFVVALKAGDAFSLYEFSAVAAGHPISSLSFDTLGVGFFSNGGKEHFGQGLSHADLFSVASPVPEPSSTLLLLAGGALLAVAMRRRGES